MRAGLLASVCMALRIVAIICARNEELHVAAVLGGLIAQRIEVVLIDHASSDETRTRAASHLDRGLIGIEHMEWRGGFSLASQLVLKERIIASLDCDWVIHADADEWLQAPVGAPDLRTAIEEA